MTTEKLNIPILDLSPEIDMLWDELQDAIKGVLRSGHFIMGPNVVAFEQAVAEYLGARFAVGVNSGTDALFIALKVLGIGPGDEIITTPFTFFATAEAISHVGATPVFVDIDPLTYNINPNLIEAAITPRTKAIIPVHLFGQPVDLESILSISRKYGLKVVEDVAQAFGATYQGRKVGTLGDVSAFSFFPSKNLGAFGDGGLIATDDPDVAEMAKKLRAHGSLKKYYNEMVGYNSRLDEIQAAILRVKLPRVEGWNQGRQRAAEVYGRLLCNVDGVRIPYSADSRTHVYHQYTVRIQGGKRDRVQQLLAEVGISTMVYYPIPVHKLPVYSSALTFLEAEAAAAEVLSLPIWPHISREQQERVANALLSALRKA